MHTFHDHITSHYDVNPDTMVVFQPEIYHSSYEKRSFEYARVISFILIQIFIQQN